MLASVKLISHKRPPTHPPRSFLLHSQKQEFSPRLCSLSSLKKNTTNDHLSTRFKTTVDGGRSCGRTHLVFVLFYSRLGHRIDGRESGDQVQMRSFMPRLQKLNYLCPAAAAERTAGGKEGRGRGADKSQPYAWDSSLLISPLFSLLLML